VVHGGAGTWRKSTSALKRRLEVLRKACCYASEFVQESALDACEEAVAFLEESGVFNAGRGGVPTAAGTVELDAGIMDGRTLAVGAVSCVTRVPSPIRLARRILELKGVILVVGETANKLADMWGLASSEPLRPKRFSYYVRKLEHGELGYLTKDILEVFRHLGYPLETVGAVAVDKEGNVAAACSTGGLALKMPGRVGDSPLAGAGFYADNRGAAVSCTGVGEVIIRLAVAHLVSEYVRMGRRLSDACRIALQRCDELRPPLGIGLIALDSRGNTAVAHTTPRMLYVIHDVRSVVKTGLRA